MGLGLRRAVVGLKAPEVLVGGDVEGGKRPCAARAASGVEPENQDASGYYHSSSGYWLRL